MYSQNVEELLRRRKVYREIIFKYLAAQGVAVPPSSEKHLLIERVKQLWSGQLTARALEHRKPPAQVSAAAGNPQGAQHCFQHDRWKCGSAPVGRSQTFLTLGWFGFSWVCLFVFEITTSKGVCSVFHSI